MGNAKSKIKPGSRVKVDSANGRNGNAAHSDRHDRQEEEDLELSLMRRAIKRDPESFILNNLMMCVQFFENYEKEIEHVKETLVSSREAELNKNLPSQKHILLPDILQEHVARKVGFTSTRQTLRPTVEPLHPVRIYVIHNNMEITEQSYSHYSHMNNAIMYNVLLRPTAHEGYVQLQLLEEASVIRKTLRALKEPDLDLSSISEGDYEMYSDSCSVYGPNPVSQAVLSRRTKPRKVGSSPYDHSRSLDDLQDPEIFASDRKVLSQDNLYESRSSRNGKVESNYDHAYLPEERRYQSRNGGSRTKLPSGDSRRLENQASRLKGLQTPGHSASSSTSSGYKSENSAIDSDSSCTVPQNSRLHEYTSGGSDSTLYSGSGKEDYLNLANGEQPMRCFKKVTYTPDGRIYDPRREKKQVVNSKQRRIKQAQGRFNYDLFYISSTEFMRHFTYLFVNELAGPLGFDHEAVKDMKRQGCVVYCDKIMVSNGAKYSRMEQYEIMPAVWLDWPSCAEEWLDRPRSTWPHYDDVGKIKDFGCHVVPEGYVPRKGNNLIQDLEWQLIFPAAERYLETCMTQSQVHVYLIALMLHKTFMRPVLDTMFGLTTAHIRNKLFWMIEENDRPSKWPENRAGECLVSLLNSLYYNVSQNEPTLMDYFVRDRNLFQRIPCDHLLHTQKQLKRIIENPVMYVFHAMENVRHNESFFPRLDYTMLLTILTVDIMALVNPALMQYVTKPISRAKEESKAYDEKYDRTGFWDKAKNQRDRPTYSTRTPINKTLINPRKATDSIIEISIRCAELEGPRLCALLDFFIRHFIKIAERCHQYRANRQKTVYLDQADRLSVLLSEFQKYKKDAKAYREKIETLRSRNANSKLMVEAPEIPKRNVEAPMFAAPLKNRFAQASTSKDSTYMERKAEDVYKQSYLNIHNHQQTTEAVVHQVRFNVNEVKENDSKVTERNEEAEDLSTMKRDLVVKILDEEDEILTNETTYI